MSVVQLLSLPGDDTLAASLRQGGHFVRRAASVDDLAGGDCIVIDDGAVDSVEAAAEVVEDLQTPFVVASGRQDRAHARAWMRAGAADLFSKPISPRELIVRLTAVLEKKRRVVCIGGGTGLFNLLRGLTASPDIHPTSIVTVFDDGGSSGRLRAEFGVLPPGDVRRSLVALSDAPQLMNDVIQYRFEGGEGLRGHSLGNLILTALSDLMGGLPMAVRALGDILHIRGVVLCTSPTSATLCAEMEDGTVVRGESAIDRCEDRSPELRIRRLWQEPEAECSVDAYAAILAADTIVIGPGDLYTSIAANLIVHGIAEAIAESRAAAVYVCNVMTKPGETYGYTAGDHVKEVVRYLGGDHLDYVVVSRTAVPDDMARSYAALGQHPVTGAIDGITRATLVQADLSDATGLFRHDSTKLARVLDQILPADPNATAQLLIPPI